MLNRTILGMASVVALVMYAGVVTAAGNVSFVLPRAEDALAKPALSPEQKAKALEDKQRAHYAELIRKHDFGALEKAAGAAMTGYSAGRVTADDFGARIFVLVPLKDGAKVLPDLLAWTRARPKSYAAWYALGRQYHELALEARGGELAAKTSDGQFAQMHKYADLAWSAYQKSVLLYAKPIPSYAKMIGLERLAGPFPFGSQKTVLCGITVGSLRQRQCHPDITDLQDAILQEDIRIEPNDIIAYTNYFQYGVPRWGGSLKHLNVIYDAAARSGKVTARNLAKISSELLYWEGDEAVLEKDLDLQAVLSEGKESQNYERHQRIQEAAFLAVKEANLKAARLKVKAYEVSPMPENLRWLYEASEHAGNAGDSKYAKSILSIIINARPGEYNAFVKRSMQAQETDPETVRHLKEDLSEAAKLGAADAQYSIGCWYMTGYFGFPLDLQQARKWMMLSANQGFPEARQKMPELDAMIARETAKKAGK